MVIHVNVEVSCSVSWLPHTGHAGPDAFISTFRSAPGIGRTGRRELRLSRIRSIQCPLLIHHCDTGVYTALTPDYDFTLPSRLKVRIKDRRLPSPLTSDTEIFDTHAPGIQLMSTITTLPRYYTTIHPSEHPPLHTYDAPVVFVAPATPLLAGVAAPPLLL